MKKVQFDLNMALSVELNILRLRRWINRHLSRNAKPRRKAGDRRYSMAYRANGKRWDQVRLFRWNAFRNPARRRAR
jgi:hypothetical protein